MIFKLNFQVTNLQALISQYETTIDAGDVILRSRTMQIRFHLDEQHFGHVQRQIFLKCVANIEQIPNMKRQTSELVYIQSDDLQNLRLINSQSMGECDKSCYLKVLFVRKVNQSCSTLLVWLNAFFDFQWKTFYFQLAEIRLCKNFSLQNRKVFVECSAMFVRNVDWIQLKWKLTLDSQRRHMGMRNICTVVLIKHISTLN